MFYLADRDELSSILLNNQRINILSYADRILELVPELIICNNCEHEHRAHKYNVFIHILHVVAGVNCDLILKLSALFHDIGKPYVKKRINDKVRYIRHQEVSAVITNLVLTRLGYDKNIIDIVCTLIKIHDDKVTPTVDGIQAVVDNIGKENFERLLALQISDISAHVEDYADLLLPKLNDIKNIYDSHNFS